MVELILLSCLCIFTWAEPAYQHFFEFQYILCGIATIVMACADTFKLLNAADGLKAQLRRLDLSCNPALGSDGRVQALTVSCFS